MKETTLKFDENGLAISIGWVWLGIVFGIIAFLIGLYVFKKFSKRLNPNLVVRKITTNFGMGEVELEVDYSLKQTAYAIYVELTTRKIALPFEEDKDVIEEVYNSWYKAFEIIRKSLREAKVESIDERFVDAIQKVLNEGLREHLTNWQAKFRKWYKEECEKEENKGLSPQAVQRKFEQYDELVTDIKKTNSLLQELANGLRETVFGKSKEK